MSLRLVSKITITQQPTTTYPNRRNFYVLDFVEDVQIKSTWKNLTTTCTIKFPRNIYIKTPDGNVNWVSQSAYTPQTGNTNPPILLRGDRISVQLGYYYNPGNGYITQLNEEFNGFITKINPKMPMEIECEDMMWLLKQAQCPNMVFKSGTNTANYIDNTGHKRTITQINNWSVQSILESLLLISSTNSGNTYIQNVLLPQLSQINVINGVGESTNVQTNVGDFRTVNETIAGVLMRLRKDYKLECFFRPKQNPPVTSGNVTTTTSNWNNLYCSGIVYYPDDYINPDGTFKTFAYGFQQNITDNGNNLVYLRKDDVRLGIKAYSVGKYKQTSTNSEGKPTTKTERLEVQVGDTDGDLRTQFFWADNNTPVLDKKTLTALATQRLNKIKFEGWRGTFESFGLPYLQNGQAVSLNDTVSSGTNIQNGQSITMERGGIYLVEGTEISFGQNGFRRKIKLHLRLDNQNYKQSDFQNGL